MASAADARVASVSATAEDPEAAIVEATRPAIERSPCLVSFSGGQDSSLVLAAATRLARREGLPDPIPVTWRSPDAVQAEESAWQEAVVAELGLHDWVRMETGDLLDWVGPVAARVVAQHGVRYPANAHFHEPLAAEAAGGALLTGLGGDQIFGLWRWRRSAAVLGRWVRPSPRDVVRIAYAHTPVGVRAGIAARRAIPGARPWLQPRAAAHVAARHERDVASEPPTWPERIAWQANRRALRVGIETYAAIGAVHDCCVIHPLLDPSVLDAVAATGGRHGFPSRDDALTELFPTLRPHAVRTRRDKATFGEVFTRGSALDAARAWHGEGVDPVLVDVGALREIWREGIPIGSALILQQFALQARSEPVTQR